MQRYPIAYPTEAQARSLLTASITWRAVIELGQVVVNGRGHEWWNQYVSAPLSQWGGHAPYQALGTHLTAAAVDAAALGAVNTFGYAFTPIAKQASKRRFAAYSAPLLWKLARVSLNATLRVAGRAGVSTSLKAAGISAALPTGGWSIAAALGGLAFDAWSVYEITQLRRHVVETIVSSLYP